MPSRLGLATPAVRPSMKARLSISGPSGSGKTLTMLEIATILADGEPILVIDTERESAKTYADVYQFRHIPWRPPYDPRELGANLREAGQQYAAVIVDSISHFWFGDGGTLSIADGRFGGWKVARPAQEDLVAGILDTDAHVLLGVRSKTEYAQELENGKQVVKKLGMGDRQDDGLVYELNVAADMNLEHQLTISKSRTVAVPVGRVYQPGHADEFARQYAEWLAGGEPPLSAADLAAFQAELAALDEHQRTWARSQWSTRQLPVLAAVRASQIGDVRALIADARQHAGPAAPQPEGDSDAAADSTPAAQPDEAAQQAAPTA